MLKRVLCLFFVLLLVGCRPISQTEENDYKYSILSITGTPALSLLSVIDEHNIEVTSDIDKIAQAFNTSEYDIIVSSIDQGVSSANYQFLATIVNCSHYLISTAEEYNSGEVYVMNKETLLQSVIKYLSESDLYRYEFYYCDSIDEILDGFKKGDLKAAIVDELGFNYLTSEGLELNKIESIAEDFEYQTYINSIPMYGVFVRKDIAINDLNNLANFAKTIKNSMSTYKSDKTTFNQVLEKNNYQILGFEDLDLIRESYNYCGIEFNYAVNDFDKIRTILHLCDLDIDESILIK